MKTMKTMRVPVSQVSVLTVAELDEERRRRLATELYPLFRRYITGFSFETFRDEMLFGPDTLRLALFLDDAGEIVGYAAVKFCSDRIAERSFHIMSVGLYIDLGYRASELAGLVLVRELLRYRVRNPRGSMWFAFEATSPASYQCPARLGRIYPHPVHETPPIVLDIVNSLARRHQLERVGSSPFVVRDARVQAGGLRDPGRMTRSARLKDDPYDAFYRELNPGFAEGSLLLACIPTTLRNVSAMVVRMAAVTITQLVTARFGSHAVERSASEVSE